MFFPRQTSDTESCEILNDNRRLVLTKKVAQDAEGFEPEKRRAELNHGHDDDDEYGGDVEDYHPDNTRNQQSLDSNHVESQSEWSDDDLGREEMTGEFEKFSIS